MSMGVVIDFEEGRRMVEADRVRKRAAGQPATPLLESLAAGVEAAQQSEKARTMLSQGYVGAQMQDVIQQANMLGGHLVAVGRLVQQLIMHEQGGVQR